MSGEVSKPAATSGLGCFYTTSWNLTPRCLKGPEVPLLSHTVTRNTALSYDENIPEHQSDQIPLSEATQSYVTVTALYPSVHYRNKLVLNELA